jgi:hypothetical protein
VGLHAVPEMAEELVGEAAVNHRAEVGLHAEQVHNTRRHVVELTRAKAPAHLVEDQGRCPARG